MTTAVARPLYVEWSSRAIAAPSANAAHSPSVAPSSTRLLCTKMSSTTPTVPGMDKPPSRYDVTVRVANDDDQPRTRQRSRSQLTRPHRAGTPASSARIRPRRSSAWSPWARQADPLRWPLPWPSWPTRSGLGIWSSHPAGERPVPAVMRRLVEHCLPELVVAAVAGDPDVSHAAATPGRFPGQLADARRPAHLRPARPQLVTERAVFRLVIEQRDGHLNDHAWTGRSASTITAAGSEPGPGGVDPGTVIRAGCADRVGGGQSQHRMGLVNGPPRRPQWPGRLPGRAAGAPRRQVLRRGCNALVRSLGLHLSRRLALR